MCLFICKHVYLYENLSLYAYLCIHMSVFICVKLPVFVFLSVSMSVCICGFVCQYHSFICLMQQRIQRVMRTWRDKGWLVVDGCQWQGIHWGCLVDDGQRFQQPTSPLFLALSHPVIRVTVRSCLAPIGRANNSFNNPGPCNISLLFGPRCHAKNPAMEKQLHCRKDGMTG